VKLEISKLCHEHRRFVLSCGQVTSPIVRRPDAP
jgi:hypothetical protein